jgi:2-oxo-4-hydroxy-4-carboxy--5-ureidoimidazoline (OHCU) decarboxylase
MAIESDLSNITIAPVDTTNAAPAAPAATTQPVAPSTPDATPGSATSTFSLQSYAAQQGYDTSGFKDESELAAALLRAADQATQQEPLANIGRQFAPYADKWSAFQEWQKAQEVEQQKAAEAAAKEEEKLPFEWRSVERDQSWEQHCERDPKSGRYVAKTLDGLAYAEKLNAYDDAQQRNAQDLLSKYPQYTQKLIDARLAAFEKKIDEHFERNWEQRQVRNSTDTWIQEHEKDLFAHDATGNVIIGPDGNQKLSAKGESLRMHAEALQTAGMSNPEQIREYAWRAVAADEAAGKIVPPVPVAPAPIAAPTPPNRFLSRFAGNIPGNGRTQNRGGGIPDPTAPHSITAAPSGDLREIVDRLAREQGVTL